MLKEYKYTSYDEYRRAWWSAFREAGHEPVLDSEGEPDIFALELGHCNGPQCRKCLDAWCWHCVNEEEIAKTICSNE